MEPQNASPPPTEASSSCEKMDDPTPSPSAVKDDFEKFQTSATTLDVRQPDDDVELPVQPTSETDDDTYSTVPPSKCSDQDEVRADSSYTEEDTIQGDCRVLGDQSEDERSTEKQVAPVSGEHEDVEGEVPEPPVPTAGGSAESPPVEAVSRTELEDQTKADGAVEDNEAESEDDFTDFASQPPPPPAAVNGDEHPDDDDDDFGHFTDFSQVQSDSAASFTVDQWPPATHDTTGLKTVSHQQLDDEQMVSPVSKEVFRSVIEQLFSESATTEEPTEFDADDIDDTETHEDLVDTESFEASVRHHLSRCENVDNWACVVFRYESSRMRKALLASLCIDETPANCPRYAIDCLSKEFLQPVKSSTTTPAVTAASAASVERLSHRHRKDTNSEQVLSDEANKILENIPDLSFMKAEVLTFPTTVQAP